jgi:hypothetical protein
LMLRNPPPERPTLLVVGLAASTHPTWFDGPEVCLPAESLSDGLADRDFA